jgi:hypothetical protein
MLSSLTLFRGQASKMKPGALRLQLQTVLITYYEDIKGVVRASNCTKPKVVKPKFVDHDAANAAAAITADADVANANANANTNAATPATPPDGGAPALHPHPAGRSLHQPPEERGRQGAGFQKRCWQGLRLIPIKLVCLNLIRHDTGQQPVPAYRPAYRANKKAASCMYPVQQCTYTVQQCTYPAQQCLYIS